MADLNRVEEILNHHDMSLEIQGDMGGWSATLIQNSDQLEQHQTFYKVSLEELINSVYSYLIQLPD